MTPAHIIGVTHSWYYEARLLFTWMDALVRLPTTLDVVERLIGSDILLMSADVWRKARARHATPLSIRRPATDRSIHSMP